MKNDLKKIGDDFLLLYDEAFVKHFQLLLAEAKKLKGPGAEQLVMLLEQHYQYINAIREPMRLGVELAVAKNLVKS